jgi:hypothetical protein
VKTDIETTYAPLVCPLSCSLVTPPAYVTKSGLTISVKDVVYTFALAIEYCVVDTYTLNAISDVSMVIATS